MVAVACWLALMTAVLAIPYLTNSPTLAEDVTRASVRPALLYYAIALTLLLRLKSDDWTTTTPVGRLARCCWTLAWAAYVIHVAIALGFFHHGSHADAIQHTEERSGFGEGIYVSHLFTLVWTCDVAWWWLRPGAYAVRPHWIGLALHGYLAFVVFNATVVFEEGAVRWAGVALFGWLAVWWWRR
jgi:hypothetical protein